jgi:cell division septal protein FtsQ
MDRHTSRKRSRRKQRRTRSEFKLSVPVTWENLTAKRTSKARGSLHAVSWRTRLKGLLVGTFASVRWISLGLLILVGVALYQLGADRRFYVGSAVVEGTVTLSPEAVIESSGVSGQHIFWLDPARVAQQLLEMPNLLAATVEVGLPNQVRIAVTERAPVMAWDQRGLRFWVDEQGQLMEARQEKASLLVVLSQESEELAPGARIPAEVLDGALQLKSLRPNISSLYYDRENGLSYQDGRNWRAFFGFGRDMNQKLVVYETLVEDLMARDLQPEYISVINKDKPYYRVVQPVD